MYLNIKCAVVFLYFIIIAVYEHYSIRSLSCLEVLDVSLNNIHTLPEWIFGLTSLKELSVWNCGRSELPDR